MASRWCAVADWRSRGKKVETTDEDRAAFAAPSPEVAPAMPSEAELEAMKQAELEKRIAKRPVGEGSFATGAKQGVTLGFGDELAGGAAALGALAGGVSDKMSGFDSGGMSLTDMAKEAYTGARDEERKRLDESRQADPLITGAGQIASSLLLPGLGAAGSGGGLGAAALQGAKVGAATGAASGVGEADSLAPADLVPKVLGGAAFGGVTGAAAPLVSAAGRAVLRPARKALEAAGEGADVARLATAKGATGGNIEGLKMQRLVEGKVAGQPPVKGGTKEAARVMREYGMAPKASTTEALNESARSTFAKAGEVKAALMNFADDSGAMVQPAQLANKMRQRAAELMQEAPSFKPVAEELMARADEIAATGQPLSLRIVQNEANAAGKLVGRWDDAPAKRLAQQEYVRALRDSADETVELAYQNLPDAEIKGLMARLRGTTAGVPDNAADIYRELRKVQQVARLVEDQSAESLGRAAGNRVFGMGEGQAAQVGAQVAGAPGAAVAVGGLKALRSRGAQMQATGKEAAQKAGGVLRRIDQGANTGDLGRASGGVFGAATGAMEEPLTTSGAAFSSEDQALAMDLLSRGMSPEEVASILGPQQSTTPTSMSRPALRARPSAAR